MIKRLLGISFCLCLLVSSAAMARERAKRELNVFTTAGIFYGNFDRFDVFFPIPATDISHAGHSVHVGVEYVLRNGFGIRPQLAHERVFYTSIGIQQAAKSYLVTDLLFSKQFVNDPYARWQPAIAVGPSIAFSASGKQAYLKVNGGTLYQFTRKWGLRCELSVTTEFKGLRGELAAGVNYRF